MVEEEQGSDARGTDGLTVAKNAGPVVVKGGLAGVGAVAEIVGEVM